MPSTGVHLAGQSAGFQLLAEPSAELSTGVERVHHFLFSEFSFLVLVAENRRRLSVYGFVQNKTSTASPLHAGGPRLLGSKLDGGPPEL